MYQKFFPIIFSLYSDKSKLEDEDGVKLQRS